MVLKAKDDGDIRELGLKRIKYCDAAPKTSNIVDKGDDTKADDRLPVPVPDEGEAKEDDEPTLLVEVDELPAPVRLDDDDVGRGGGGDDDDFAPKPPSPFVAAVGYWSFEPDERILPPAVGDFVWPFICPLLTIS